MRQDEVRNEYRITQSDRNVDLSAGTAGSRSLIAEFTTPARTIFVLRAGDIFSMLLQNAGGTEVADTSQVELVRADPNGILSEELVKVNYQVLKEFSDRNSLYTVGMRQELTQDDQLQIYVKANLGVGVNTQFQLSTARVAGISI